MKRFFLCLVAAVTVTVCVSNESSAHEPGAFGGPSFFPYGFYQPYGARYGTALRTSPYFATNPPVYYGARHSRPYGISPFAAPPAVGTPDGYKGRLRSQFHDHLPQSTNPYVCTSTTLAQSASKAKKGEVQINPFVEPSDRLAKQ